MNGLIGISTAIPPEYNAARNAFKLPNSDNESPFRRIEDRSGRYVLFLTGAGYDNAIMALERLILSHPFDFLLDTGTCGALAPSLTPGDIIVDSPDKGDEWAAFLEKNYSGGRVLAGAQLCVDHNIIESQERGFLYEKTGALACNRESDAIISSACNAKGKAASIRMVSDNAGSETGMQFKKEGIKRLPCYYSSLFTLIFSDLF